MATEGEKPKTSGKPKPKSKSKPVKKVSLVMGCIFMALGIVFLILLFFETEAATKATYAVTAVAMFSSAVTLLDKSNILDR